ncbi:MAG TPA: hypothetical protein VFF67_03110 [Thermoplasmata archaeon]|nr:hypothetical protein [Thermoplasmata archaeon]
MTSASLDRYGLTSNPFRELSSESVDTIEVFHVDLQVDEPLRQIKEEAFGKDNRAIVALTGGYGVGKTERLKLADTEARARGAFHVYFDVTPKTVGVIRGIADGFAEAAKTAGKSGVFSSPPWMRGVASLQKIRDTGYDAVGAGKIIAQALNENAPAFLLLNDLHNLTATAEADAFAKVLQALADTIRPGVLVMFCAYPNYLAALTKTRPALSSRINRVFSIPGMSADEAALLLAKKMLAKRLIEDLDPLYPFDREAVEALNGAANGNPRRLLELADLALEYGATHRSSRVDLEIVQTVLRARPAAASSGPAGGENAATPAVAAPVPVTVPAAPAPVRPPERLGATGARPDGAPPH